MHLVLKDFTAGYLKNEPIINSMDFELKTGEIYCVIGRNGCGKSTLLKGVLLGTPFSGGAVFYNNEKLTDRNKFRALNEIGICLPIGFSYDHLTVEENLRFISAYYPQEQISDLHSIIDLFKLNSIRKTQADKLSTGQRKKLDLAMVFSHNPKLILLDEPTSNIDLSTKLEILGIIKRINLEHKVSFLISTHLLDEIEFLNALYIILNDGKIVFDSKNVPDSNSKRVKEIYLLNIS